MSYDKQLAPTENVLRGGESVAGWVLLVIPSKSAAILRCAQDDSSGLCHPERELWIAVALWSKRAPSRSLAN